MFVVKVGYALLLMLTLSHGAALANCAPGAEGDFCRRVEEENARFEKEGIRKKKTMNREWQEGERKRRLNPESDTLSRPSQEIGSDEYRENLMRF